jgi:protein-S-isoprenylcysteine O-methyltransferase Ste14
MTTLPSLGPRGEGWVAIQGVILAAVAIAGLAGPAWADPVRLPVAAVGVGLIVAGGVLAIRGLVDLADALTPLPHPRAGAALVEHGAYRLVRHPIYGGLVLGSLGWSLVMASPVAVVAAGALLGFFRLKSAREEAWLEDHYAGYAAYRGRTRRMIPWIY